jgi:hypothetical protein
MNLDADQVLIDYIEKLESALYEANADNWILRADRDKYRDAAQTKWVFTVQDMERMSSYVFKELIVDPSFESGGKEFIAVQSLFGVYWLRTSRSVRYAVAWLASKALHKALGLPAPRGV